jgi:hypothetical protein
MRIKAQLVVCADNGREEQVQAVAAVEKPHPQIEHLGLTLAEAKSILKTLQHHLVERQTTAFVAAHAQCDSCGKPLGIKAYHTRTCRTLFGTVPLTSPRLYHCRCQRRKTITFRPLNALLTDSVAPELLFMESKWASLASYGLTVQALKDVLPVDATRNATTIQHYAAPQPLAAWRTNQMLSLTCTVKRSVPLFVSTDIWGSVLGRGRDLAPESSSRSREMRA